MRLAQARPLALFVCAAAASALHATVTLALCVVPREIVELAAPASTETDRVVREWAVSAADGPTVGALRSIVASTVCQAFVSYSASPSASAAVATVRVTGSNAAVVQQAVNVFTSSSSTSAGVLHIATPQGTPRHVTGFIRVDVIVHNLAQVVSIETAGSGEVVVDDGVLATDSFDANVTVRSTGSGDLYLPPRVPFHLQSLSIELTGSGSVYCVAGDISVGAFKIDMLGSGDVRFGANTLVVTDSMAVTAQGSGLLSAHFTQLHTRELTVVSTGSGDIKLGRPPDSSVTESDDAVACSFLSNGSGVVSAGDVSCTRVQLVAAGSGVTTVRARKSLTYSVSGSADVTYAGAAPLYVSSVSGVTKHKTIRAAPSSWTSEPKPRWVDTYSLPPRKTSMVVLEYTSDEDSDRNEAEEKENDDDNGPFVAVPTSTQHTDASQADPFPWKKVMIVVVVVLGVFVWESGAARARRRRRADENTPLVNEDTPVYI